MDLPLEFLGRLDIVTLLAIAGMFWIYNSRLDRKFEGIEKKLDVMNAKIDINKKEFNDKMDKNTAELNAKIDKNITELNTKIDTLEQKFIDKFSSIEKELGQINTRVAVIESRLSDISTNVTYLMWQNQTIPPKEDQKEN